MGGQNPVPSVFPKQQFHATIGFCGPLFQSSTYFIHSLKLLIGLFLVKLLGNVKMH